MLTIDNLSVNFAMKDNRNVKALRGASLTVRPGETLALIGESGSGKSVLGLAVISLLPRSATVRGDIWFNGENLLAMNEEQLTETRGEKIGFIPQSAGLSLNPTMKVLDQVAEAVPAPKNNGVRQIAQGLLSGFGIGQEKALSYPHQLSGGMRQRSLVAMGLAVKPALLIADEPTKGIDHQRVKDVEALFKQVKSENPDLSMLLVTHDLNLASSMADRIAVMYAGEVVETSRCDDFFQRPKHPYSRALLRAAPEHGLEPIPGSAPGVEEDYTGCAFAPRCKFAEARCRNASPASIPQNGEAVHCWRYA